MMLFGIYIAWTIFSVALGDYSVIVDTANFTAVINHQTTRITEAKLYCREVHGADLAHIENYGVLLKLSSALVEKRNIYGSSVDTGNFMIDGRTQVILNEAVDFSTIVYGSDVTSKDSNCVALTSWKYSVNGGSDYTANAYYTVSKRCDETWNRSFLCKKKSTHDPTNAEGRNQYAQRPAEVWVLAVAVIAGFVFASILTGILIYSCLRCRRVEKPKTSEKNATQPMPVYEHPTTYENDINHSRDYTSLNHQPYANKADPPHSYLTVE